MKKVMSLLIISFMLVVGLSTNAYATKKGAHVVDFSAVDMDGNEVMLSELRGDSPLLLVFFATWCPPCQKEVPKLVELTNSYSEQGLKIVAVSVDNSQNVLPAFIEKKGINYTVLHDADGAIAREYKVQGIPTNIVVNKEGVIVSRGHNPPSGKDVEQILE